MKFIVSRVSDCSRKQQPHKDAVLETVVNTEKAQYGVKDSWFQHGLNHRIDSTDNKHTRDNHYEQWTIEINSLEELMNLMKEVEDDLIISESKRYNHPSVTIFDDYL